MASGWIKSMHCKSRAFEDVYHHTTYTKSLLHSSNCKSSAQTVKDVIETAKHKHKKLKPLPAPPPPPPRQGKHPPPISKKAKPTKEPESNVSNWLRVGPGPIRPSLVPKPVFPALTELPDGHPSRNVVEIIFHTSWGPKPFTGLIEMIFKVQNGPKTAARFEEYREMVKSRAGPGQVKDGSTCEENARCAADGNEVLRFQCSGPTTGGLGYDSGSGWPFLGGKGGAICTFSGSGCAHESAGGGKGRRAMLVCRVIAGRVSTQFGLDPFLDGPVRFDSVSRGNEELLVFDSRAVLPCFLIIYRL